MSPRRTGSWPRSAGFLASTTARWPSCSTRSAPGTACCGPERRELQLDRAVKILSAPVSEDLVNRLIDTLVEEHDPKNTAHVDFLGAQFDLGLAWVNFPEGHGGLGLSPKLQKLINERLAEAKAPTPYGRNPIGYGMGAPTVVTHGSEAQRTRYLKPLFTGEEVWCQLFSEPGAGSDVAGLSMRAVRDGDEWVVNGQKVWTTLAHLARWGMLIARTDPDT